jgi:hypothetical protein
MSGPLLTFLNPSIVYGGDGMLDLVIFVTRDDENKVLTTAARDLIYWCLPAKVSVAT